MNPDEIQIGGDWYKLPIQPMEFFHKNKIPKLEGDIIQYLIRWRHKNGLEDLKKAQHLINLLIMYEENV